MSFKPEKRVVRSHKQNQYTIYVSSEFEAVLERAGEMAENAGVPKNRFILQAIEYALDNMED